MFYAPPAGRVAARSLMICTVLLVAPLARGRAQTVWASGDLTLEQARSYMLELINRDRGYCGLRPVLLDPVASRAGQDQAEEMAAHSYLAHFNLQGDSPQQRYARCGGR